MPDTTTYGTNGNDTLSGGNGKDTIYGLDGDDIISGGNGVDTLFGDGGDDQLTGDNGSDFLTGGADDDVLDGSNGFDTAYYSGPIGEYSFFSIAGYLHIVHLGGAGADGHDRVIRVERLVFADRVIEIGSNNNKPVAGDDHVFINEDTGTYSSGAASVKDNDFDFDGDPLTVTGGTFTGTYGTLTLNANGTYSYTLFASVQALDDGETVTDSFNYTVSDNDGSDTGTLVFHIAGLNDAPVANDDTASTTEDAAASGNVLTNDTDIDVEPLVVANPGTYVGAYGTLVLAANGSYTYTPNAAAQALDDGEVVSDAFGYTASDGTASDTATLTVTVTGLNDAPVANDDTASTTEDAAVSGNVLTNDTDVDVEPLTVTTPGTYVGTYGTLVLAANGSYTYTPNAGAQALDDGEVVSDAFGYTASDGTASDTATLTVNVAGLNDAPVANDDTASTTEDAAVSGNVLTNDTDVDVETLTVANAGTYAGAYGTLVLAADGSYTYTPNAAAQGLDDGETVSDVFSYTASDGTASDTATLTVTVTGLNDAPVANDDTASTTEDAAVSGNVLTNDTDVDVEPLTVANPGTYVGTYGTLVLAADGSYTYTPNAGAQGLDDGEVVSDVFSYTASDGTASDTATLTVNVAGLNDAPVANDDTASTTEDAAASGNVLANDTDVDVETLTVANSGTYAGAYGTLVLAADGSYTYTPNAAAQGLDDGESVSDVFSYTASDGTASDTATLTVTVTGLNDAPVANDDSASTNEDAAVSGNVLTNDTDVDVEPLTVTTPGTYVGTYGTLVLAANGGYTYTPNAAANGLAAGEVAQDVFSYTASDGTASDSATLTVTVNGTNDAPTIDAGGTDDSGSVTELPNNDPNENTFTHTDSGTIAFDDVDVTDTHTASFMAQGGGYLGTFTLDPVNQAGDTVGWDFSVADSDLDFLADGQTLTQTYEVEIDDGNGGTVTQDVTITITGEADGPQTVWYIDNSAVGSTNVGTQANPFISIAAFNTAQGTVGGPQVGATVYLLAGTGTYAEADGLNLLNDQIVTGVASGPLRPTIVTTGGGSDGIELALNNTISGLDIGNTNDTGITDSNGSVGNLTISDVGKTGTGQIVDIDQGGNLNVTLNEATSTASNDGAIDLNNLAGSFTVTGATTITGIHSDGGIDITNSSLTATFAGGGTVSTNNAIAVNFVGNTGALVLGGGLDIATTTGTGLNASGGGTLTAIGTGNSINSFFGTSLKVANTTIGAPGLTFESISAGSAVGSAGVGISLINTGSVGGLTVTGTGSAGSGGVIQHKTGIDGSTTSGIGIYLENTSEVSLNEMDLHDFDNHAIFGQSVNGIRVTDSTIGGVIGTTTGSNDAAVAFGTNGLTNGFANGASSLFDNVDISGGVEHNFEVYQTSDTFHLTITDSSIHDNSSVTGSDGLLIETVGTAHAIIRVATTSFDDDRGDAVQATALGSSHLELTLHDNDVFTSTQGSQGFILQNGASADLTAAVTDNTLLGVLGTNILVGSVAGNATSAAELNATVSGNQMTLDAAATNRTLIAFFSSTVGQISTAKVTIDSNTINTIVSNALEPLFVTTPDAGTDPLVYTTVSNNVVNIDDNGLVAGRGIVVQSIQNVSTMHADVRGNDVNYLDGAPPGVVGIRVRQANPATLDLEPGVGGATAALVLANNNPLSTTQIVGTVTVSANNSVVLPPSTPATPNLPSFLLVGFDADLLPGSGGAGDTILTQAALDGLVDTAIDLLSDAGATAAQIAAMDAVSFTVGDLFGRRLGSSEPGAVVLDSDAAGYGWFVDATSGGSEGRIDALTVVLHELGHQIGLEDDYHGSGADLMHGYLNPGESRLPAGIFSAEPEPASDAGLGWGDLAMLVPDTTIV